MQPLNEITAAEASRLLATGTISSEDLVRACLDRCSKREPAVQAWEYLDPEHALRQARTADASPRRSSLHGIPIGIKDIFDTSDMPTAHGFPPYKGERSGVDSRCVAVLRAAGMVIMGKTVTTEFACPLPRHTLNPLDPARSPGVSSSGSAAAVADHMIPLSIGSQTGGSVIVPAAYCGVYGYKSSPTGLDRTGYRHCKPSLDTIGLFARSIEDLVLLRGIETGNATTLPHSLPAPRRIGVVRTARWDLAEPSMRTALSDASRTLADAGAPVEDLDLPDTFADMDEDFMIVNGWETRSALARELSDYRDDVNAFNKRKFAFVDTVGQAAYEAASARVRAAQAELDQIISGYDVLISPSTAGEAIADLRCVVPDDFARPWSLMQLPAASLPLFAGAAGLPLGLQVIGKRNGDASLLDYSAWIDARIREALPKS
ncbi:MAG: hypothetical protein RLZ98_1502 [Pseudomonadota bacterium]